jgi:hypothetical protein
MKYGCIFCWLGEIKRERIINRKNRRRSGEEEKSEQRRSGRDESGSEEIQRENGLLRVI